MGLRCYVCGKPIEDRFVVVSMSETTDRAFVVHTGSCIKQVDGDLKINVPVKATK